MGLDFNPKLRVNRYILPKFATIGVTTIAVSFGLAACEGRNPFDIGWTQTPDTVLLYSFARELGLPSAFDFHGRVSRIVEAPLSAGLWDVMLDTQDDQLVFLLPEVLGIPSEARIIELPGLIFDDVREAPADTTAYTSDEAVPLALGSVYVIRTKLGPDRFGLNCVFYAKMEALKIDVLVGTLRFVYDANPLCSDRDLIPPDKD